MAKTPVVRTFVVSVLGRRALAACFCLGILCAPVSGDKLTINGNVSVPIDRVVGFKDGEVVYTVSSGAERSRRLSEVMLMAIDGQDMFNQAEQLRGEKKGLDAGGTYDTVIAGGDTPAWLGQIARYRKVEVLGKDKAIGRAVTAWLEIVATDVSTEAITLLPRELPDKGDPQNAQAISALKARMGGIKSDLARQEARHLLAQLYRREGQDDETDKVVGGAARAGVAANKEPLAEAPEKLYEQVYGEESRAVQTSPEAEVAVAFAKKLIADAQSLRDDPAFAVFMLGKAYDLGSKDVAGYPVAIDALKAILDRVPDRKNEWRDKLLSLARLWCQKASPAVLPAAAEQLVVQLIRAGDEQRDDGNPVAAADFFSEAVQVATRNHCPSLDTARGRLQGAKQDSAGEKRRAAYEAALKANPMDSAAARGLALFWILETDTPGNALPYLGRSGDEKLKKYGALAVRSTAEVGESDLLSVGDWYWELALKATDTAKTRALGKASTLYARFLDVHPQQDGMALKARKRAEDVNKAMAAMGNGPVVMGPPGKVAGMGVRFFGEGGIAGGDIRYVCYVIDHSGSVLSAFDEIIGELKSSIRGLRETQDFHLVFFAKDTFQENPARRLVPASDANKSDALTFLKEIRAAGYGSSPIPALTAAFKAFRTVPTRPGEGKVLYLLTDGDFDTSAYKYIGLVGNHAVIRWLRDNNANKAVHVYPIIMGEKPSAETAESMRKIASENGGEFRFVERKY